MKLIWTLNQALHCCALPFLSMAAPGGISLRSSLTVSQLVSIAPTSVTCGGAPYPSECRTASQALPHIVQAFNTYQINSASMQAAILSTIAYESGDFKYQKNYFPGNPGQGTRNMQSLAFNLQYARSIPALSSRLSEVESVGPNGVRDLLITNDDWDFGSAAWFLVTQCGQEVLTALGRGDNEGFSAYLGCVGTDMNEVREAYWQRAITALKSSTITGNTM